MTTPRDNDPILVGVGQETFRDQEPEHALEPVEMMAVAARKAEEDAETKGLLARVDSVRVVNVLSWRYSDAAGLLAEQVGASPREKLYTTMGGNTPQWLVNETAAAIANGEVGVALLAGAEALDTLRRARKADVTPSWTTPGKSPPMIGERRGGIRDVEVQHGAALPISVYPLFENAIRVATGLSAEEHQQQLGELCASFARIAGDNPYAWFRDSKSGDVIANVSDTNRLVGSPYTKYMNAMMDVDQAAAVIMTSVGEARRLGIPESRWVYFLGGAEAADHWFVTDRVNYSTSPAIELAGRRSLELAGVTIDQIDHFDLYSCFPSAVQIGRDMLGIPEDRPLTVTGGLAYAGGPGNNYTMHAIVNMVERLREQPGSKGLVTALGWYITKHAVGVYGTVPSENGWRRPDAEADQREIDAAPHPQLAERPDGPATIETYTVVHGRDGEPDYAIVIGRLENGDRFIANTAQDRSLLETMVETEMIGVAGKVRHDDASEKNVFALS